MADELNRLRQQHKLQQERLSRQVSKEATLRILSGGADATDLHGTSRALVVSGPGLGSYSDHVIYIKSKRPIMAKVKEVVEYLVSTKRVVSSKEIRENCKYDLNFDDELMKELKLHPQVKIVVADNKSSNDENISKEAQTDFSLTKDHSVGSPGNIHSKLYLLSYLPTFDVRSRAELLTALERLPEGIAVKDLIGTYENVVHDIKKLNETGEVIVLRGVVQRDIEGGGRTEESQEILFPGKHRLPIFLDQAIAELYHSIPMPKDSVSFRQEVLDAGISLSNMYSTIQPTLDVERSKARNEVIKKGGKRKRRREVELRTNVHLKNDARFQFDRTL